MKRFISAGIVLFLLLLAPALRAEDEGFKFSSNPQIANVKPKKPVRVKLQRLGDGRYTWELSGDDVDELMKTDRMLRKLFTGPSEIKKE